MNPEDIGLELSKQLKISIESIPGALSLIENQEVLNLEDIDNAKLATARYSHLLMAGAMHKKR